VECRDCLGEAPGSHIGGTVGARNRCLGTQVALTGVVATSPKFLASLGATGTCYWGVFVSEPVPQAVPYSGGLVLNTGTNAVLEASGLYGACPTGTDLIPDDTAPGDVLSVTATLVSYVRADCATTTAPAPVPEVAQEQSWVEALEQLTGTKAGISAFRVRSTTLTGG
jgi:hypothetical protein